MADALHDTEDTKPIRRRRVSTAKRASADKAETVTPRRVRATRGAVAAKVAPVAPPPEPPKTVAKAPVRKAPTPISAARREAKQKQRSAMIVGAVLLAGIGASAAVGFTDAGQIDVTQTIEARNERIRNNKADERDTIVSNVEVPVQNTSKKADGGLVPSDTPPAPIPLPAPASDETNTASSSEQQSATSTDEVSLDDPEVPTEAESAVAETSQEADEEVAAEI